MMMENYKDALNDGRKAISIDDKYTKAYERIIKCCLALGDVVGAEQAIEKLTKIGTMNEFCRKFAKLCTQLCSHNEKIDKWFGCQNYKRARM